VRTEFITQPTYQEYHDTYHNGMWNKLINTLTIAQFVHNIITIFVLNRVGKRTELIDIKSQNEERY